MIDTFELLDVIKRELYGPKWCPHCNQVRHLQTYELEKSFFTKLEGNVYTCGFVGAQICGTCFKNIDEAKPPKSKW